MEAASPMLKCHTARLEVSQARLENARSPQSPFFRRSSERPVCSPLHTYLGSGGPGVHLGLVQGPGS